MHHILSLVTAPWVQLLRFVFFISGKALSVASSKTYKKTLNTLQNRGYYAPYRNNSASLEAFNHKELKTGHGIHSSGDTARQILPAIKHKPWENELLPFLDNQLSKHTRRAYETDLKQFFEFLSERNLLKNIQEVQTEHLVIYRKFLEEGRFNGKIFQKTSINRKIAVVKTFFQWLKANRVISDNPAEWVKSFPQSQESSLLGLSDDEAKKILQAPKLNSRSGALHSAILHVLLMLGLRKGELIDLKMGDLSEERGVPVIKVRGKGHRIRVLPITSDVKQKLEHYFYVCKRSKEATEEPLFTPTKNPFSKNILKMLNPNAITYIVQKYAKKAGVLKKISPHSCRATCISNALDKKATHRSVQYLAGWSTPLMIQRYDKRREELKNSAAYLIDYNLEASEVKATV